VSAILQRHHAQVDAHDRVALVVTQALLFVADTFFASRCRHRAAMLEAVAAMLGMVAGALIHLRLLRCIEGGAAWNRMLPRGGRERARHLMTFVPIAGERLRTRADHRAQTSRATEPAKAA
jgi:hypothetical protein